MILQMVWSRTLEVVEKRLRRGLELIEKRCDRDVDAEVLFGRNGDGWYQEQEHVLDTETVCGIHIT